MSCGQSTTEDWVINRVWVRLVTPSVQACWLAAELAVELTLAELVFCLQESEGGENSSRNVSRVRVGNLLKYVVGGTKRQKNEAEQRSFILFLGPTMGGFGLFNVRLVNVIQTSLPVRQLCSPADLRHPSSLSCRASYSTFSGLFFNFCSSH